MRRPHVYERSAPRTGREAYREPAGSAAVGAIIAERLVPLIAMSEATRLNVLTNLLKVAKSEADGLLKS